MLNGEKTERTGEILLSVVVPVYGVEATLDRCVTSILSQDVSDMEVILVDDGSPDACPAMCDAWAHDEPRVSVIHRANGGLSAARNSALDVVRGRYVAFVDSDDRLEPGTLQPLVSILEGDARCDMLEFPMRRVLPDGAVVTLSQGEHRYDEPLRYWVEGRCYAHSYVCNKVFRRSAIGATRFEEGRAFEDVRFVPQILRRARTVMTTDVGAYVYDYRADSITATADARAMRDLLEGHLSVMFGDVERHRGYADYYMHVVNIQIVDYEMSRERPLLPPRRVDMGQVSRCFRLKAICLRLFGLYALCRIVCFIRRIAGRSTP